MLNIRATILFDKHNISFSYIFNLSNYSINASLYLLSWRSRLPFSHHHRKALTTLYSWKNLIRASGSHYYDGKSLSALYLQGVQVHAGSPRQSVLPTKANR